MRRWFLSYNSQDLALMQALETALRRRDASAQIFFAPNSVRAGGYWLPELAKAIEEATAFVLLIGKNGLGPWQVMEYYEAMDRRVKEHNFPVILVLLQGQPAPGLPFLRQLHWIVTADPASEQSIAQLMEATAGHGTRPGEMWRHAAPYRGLAAMTESDSDFFFGRTRETIEVIKTLAATPDKIPILLGNSGVGKSSLAQAGVLAALARQNWSEYAKDAGPWPQVFHESRHWCFLKLRPGTEPLKALVEPFLRTWQFEATDPLRARRQAEWVEGLRDGKLSLRDLLDATEQRHEELQQPKSPAFFLYIDQGEELYVRGEDRQSRRFSEVIARGLGDPRLYALMSLRADFIGELQSDEPLYAAHKQINVPPLREAELRDIVSRPAQLLSARFETDSLPADVAQRAAAESAKDVGALPLLSYLLDDMWTQMVERGDGKLRLPAQAIELGGVLVERANAFLARHPNAEDQVRRIFTLKLATVREDGEPTRRRALRSEFNDEEWRLVSELADHPNRLLVAATEEAGETAATSQISATKMPGAPKASHTYAEVAHEAIFRRWDRLRDWIVAEREFLAWRSGLEGTRRAWQAAPDNSKNSALLMGFALAKAQSWSVKRANDLPKADQEFVARSIARDRSERTRARRTRVLVGILLAGTAGIAALAYGGWLNPFTLRTYRNAFYDVLSPKVLAASAEHALTPGQSFSECTFCPEMVVVPAGEFTMGSPEGEKDRRDSEGPQHKVTFASAFSISKFEVTFDEWDACYELGGCKIKPGDQGWGRGRQPIVNVNWEDAQEYVTWLSKHTGRPYRLVTEAEWEYAARAGSEKTFSRGDDLGKDNANCNGCGSRWDNKQTAPVGSFAPNAFGIHDMHGNVIEWVQDCYMRNYTGAPVDGSDWSSGDCSFHVVRGGSWQYLPRMLRSANRNWIPPANRYGDLGFRVARTLAP